MGVMILSGSIRGEVGLRLKNEVVILSRKKISYKVVLLTALDNRERKC